MARQPMHQVSHSAAATILLTLILIIPGGEGAGCGAAPAATGGATGAEGAGGTGNNDIIKAAWQYSGTGAMLSYYHNREYYYYPYPYPYPCTPTPHPACMEQVAQRHHTLHHQHQVTTPTPTPTPTPLSLPLPLHPCLRPRAPMPRAARPSELSY